MEKWFSMSHMLYEEIQIKHNARIKYLMPIKSVPKKNPEGWKMINLVQKMSIIMPEVIGDRWYDEQKPPNRNKL